MAKFIVFGDKNSYLMEAKDYKDAWECALSELKYGLSGNKKVEGITKK